MKTNKFFHIAIAALVLAGSVSCDKWLDISSDNEVLEQDAFTSSKGYRNALIGVYRQMAGANLWGQELTWGAMSAFVYEYNTSFTINKYKQVISAVTNDPDYFRMNVIQSTFEGIWGTSYTAIANLNNLIQEVEGSSVSDYESPFEKDVILGEAYGLRGLLHFTLAQLFVQAPAVGGEDVPAIPYVDSYPSLQPSFSKLSEVLDKAAADLEKAREKLYEFDVVEGFGKAHYYSGGKDIIDVDNYFFKNWGAYNTNGIARDKRAGGFFSSRGTRLNWWGATALLARLYSYRRDFTNAEKYADILLDEWVASNRFHLLATPTAASDVEAIDGKRRPESLMSLWNQDETTIYLEATNNLSNNQLLSNLKYLFTGEEATDYRYNSLFNQTTKYYRVWYCPNETKSADVETYSTPLLPVIELPEIYCIKAECQAKAGDVDAALATLKNIRDARGCATSLAASDYDSFLKVLVYEVQRDGIMRGWVWPFLKKLNWPELFYGQSSRRWAVPEGWWVFPIPDTETSYR
jgi:hypothetical protein